MVSVASGVRYFIIVIFGFVHFSFFSCFSTIYSLCISSALFCCILYFFSRFQAF